MMKKRLGVLLAAALTVATAFTAVAADDLTGEWYTNLFGMSVTLTLNEGGECVMEMEAAGEEVEEPTVGTWEFDGESLIIDKGKETEVTAAYDGELLTAESEGMEMVFSRDPEAAKGFVPAEIVKDAKLEDFAGNWIGKQISAMGMTAPLDMMEIEKVDIEIKDNLVALDIAGGFLLGEHNFPGIEAELKDGALYVITPAENEYSEDTEWKICLHEDGTLSMSISMMDEEMTIYMESKAEEAEEEVAE